MDRGSDVGRLATGRCRRADRNDTVGVVKSVSGGAGASVGDQASPPVRVVSVGNLANLHASRVLPSHREQKAVLEVADGEGAIRGSIGHVSMTA